MASTIYYTRSFDEQAIESLFSRLYEDQGIDDNKVAIKTHFGEKGNTRYVSPRLIKPITKYLQGQGHSLFVTDTNTLYPGSRLTATDHENIAREHGFDDLGIPIVIADGEHGDDEYDISVGQKHFSSVKIGRAIADVGAMVVISHFKGHILFGFGAALKNLGMGGGSRAGKLAMHSQISPSVNTEACTGCGVCADNCAHNAIEFIDGKAGITEACVGCARCIAVCPTGAVKIPWHGASSNQAQERCAEYAAGTVKDKEILYVTFINNLTKDCDCLSDSEIIGEDLGVVAGTDPVAVDKAAHDLIVEHHGRDIFREATGVDGTHIISYAEEMGLGTQEYDLVPL